LIETLLESREDVIRTEWLALLSSREHGIEQDLSELSLWPLA